jgi:hypothetical protein
MVRLHHEIRSNNRCLSARERQQFARMLGKIEKSFDLAQSGEEASKADGYRGGRGLT